MLKLLIDDCASRGNFRFQIRSGWGGIFHNATAYQAPEYQFQLRIRGQKNATKRQIQNGSDDDGVRLVFQFEMRPVVCSKGCIHHGHVDVLPAAGLIPQAQSSQHADQSME